jgi:hypothetical protein
MFYDSNKGTAIKNSVIIGNSKGGNAPAPGVGAVLAWDRGEIFENVKFYNYPNPDTSAMVPNSIAGRCTTGCGGWINKFRALSFSNVRYKHTLRWNWDNIMVDLDGTLTGTQGARTSLASSAGNVVVFKDNITSTRPNCVDTNEFLNGIVCSNTNNWIRFAFNNFQPSFSLLLNITNKNNQMASSPKLAKRLTHPNGFMMSLEAKQEYLLQFDQAERPTNMSYSGTFYSLYPEDFLIIKHTLSKKPDRVFVLDSNQLSTENLSPLTSANNNGDWYWDNSTFTMSYIIINKNTSPQLDGIFYFLTHF